MSIIHIDRPFPTDLDLGQHTAVGPDPSGLGDAEAAIVGGARWDAAAFDRAPMLTVLARTGIGVDAVDLAEATRRGIAVTNTPDGPTVSTAEHAMALIFAAAKELPRQQERLRKATGDYAVLNTARELDGGTIGLLAYGRIARRVAVMARAIGMTVLATDPFLTDADLAGDPAGTRLVDLETLCREADVLSLHAPLTPDTDGLFDTDRFESCKDGVVFVNCARGGLVDHDALMTALRTGKVSNAGLDVTDPEPLPPDHPLLNRDDVIVTPHTASSTTIGRRRMLDMAVEQARQALAGQRPTHLVNTDLTRPSWEATS